MPFLIERLHVYQRAVDFADVVLAATERFPRGYGCLADQLNRAAISIATNLAEGNGRFTKADRRNFFGIARGSMIECVPLLELARRRRLIEDNDHAALSRRLEEIARMLSGLINGLTDRSNNRSVTPATSTPARHKVERLPSTNDGPTWTDSA
ncbi:MAG: four helix bundle protein [Phycisphaerales bacterium]|jgi:four helix bundle protein